MRGHKNKEMFYSMGKFIFLFTPKNIFLLVLMAKIFHFLLENCCTVWGEQWRTQRWLETLGQQVRFFRDSGIKSGFFRSSLFFVSFSPFFPFSSFVGLWDMSPVSPLRTLLEGSNFEGVKSNYTEKNFVTFGENYRGTIEVFPLPQKKSKKKLTLRWNKLWSGVLLDANGTSILTFEALLVSTLKYKFHHIIFVMSPSFFGNTLEKCLERASTEVKMDVWPQKP